MDLRVGCAGWSIPHGYADRFPLAGSHLERYAGRFPAVEIDSSFYRTHRPATYERWAGQVPGSFRFAVKVPRQVTHQERLSDPARLDDFLAGVSALGPKLGPLLLQLPPSLAFDAAKVAAFFSLLRSRFTGILVCEPRHVSWFEPRADRLLAQFEVARVAADPALLPAAAEPGGWAGLLYYRLHGSPRVYYSSYPEDYLDALATRLVAASQLAPVWCIFDNTAAGAATGNALDLQRHIERLHTTGGTLDGASGL